MSATAGELDEHVVDGRLDVALGEALDELLAEGEHLGHVGGDAELEDRAPSRPR